ncbi:MAG: hypothetical protein FD153_1168 [Rhodospirillaceae bacterium]|nr:MAG: hypothetical protein FD153_1168 [Rhodospirillaceae bacterium]
MCPIIAVCRGWSRRAIACSIFLELCGAFLRAQAAVWEDVPNFSLSRRSNLPCSLSGRRGVNSAIDPESIMATMARINSQSRER